MRRLSAFCFRCVARLILASMVMGGAYASGVPAVDASLSEKKTEQPGIVLEPKLEVKLKAFLDKAKVAKGKLLDERMKKEIEDIVKVTGLGDAGQQALEMQAKPVVEACVADWASKLGVVIRQEISSQPTMQAGMILDQMQGRVDLIVQGGFQTETIMPMEQDGWTQALHKTLSPEQTVAWDKTLAERKEAIEKQMGDILKNGADRTRNQYQQGVHVKCEEIEIALGLAKDRADKLEDLGKRIADQCTELWHKRAESVLLSMDDAQRLLIVQNNGNFFVQPQPDELPIHQAAWKEGLAQILTADEVKRLQAESDERKSKRAQIMAQVMIMLLDEKIDFTAAQREKLQPIAYRLVKDVNALYPDTGFGDFLGLPAGTFISVGANASEAELRPILDDVQLKHWWQVTKPESTTADSSAAAKSKPEATGEPEDVERLISDFLYEKTEDERAQVLGTNLLKAEDAVRAAGLNAETASRLQAATRGATEEYLIRWKWFVEQQVRSQLREVTPQNVRQRLDGIQDYFFQQNFGVESNPQSIWERTVKVALTAKEQEAWQKELDARDAFREKTIAAMVMSEFDRRSRLTSDQWNKLQPLITGVIHDYGPDISRMFSPVNPVPWYLEGFYVLMPFVGIPDKDLKAILTKNQWDQWNGSQEHGNVGNLWQNAEQIHTQRVKTK